MNSVRRVTGRLFAFWLMCLFLVVQVPLALAAEQADDEEDLFPVEQIEQLVAPVALYPDALLAQILMASTYPLEVVSAARWAVDNPDIKGDELEDAMEKQSWDSSVRSLTAFPDVLKMMNEQLDWTQKLGDAFLMQQQDVLDAVQTLRKRAKAEGNLDDIEELDVQTEEVELEDNAEETAAAKDETEAKDEAEAQEEAESKEEVETAKEEEADTQTAGTSTAGSDSQTTTVIVVEPSNPEVIFVPVYNPTVVFGVWPHPLFRPFFWHPAAFVVTPRLFWFGAGVVASRALWGGVSWRRRSVSINVTRYNSFNRTSITSTRWRHNPRHRGAVPYRGRRVSERYGRGRQRDTRSRDEFRGRAERGRQELRREGAAQRRDGSRAENRQNRQAGQNREARQNRETRQNREARQDRQAGQNRETRQNRQAGQNREARQNRQGNQNRQTRQNRQNNQTRNRRSVTSGSGNASRARQNSSRGRASRQANRQRPNRSGGRRRR